MPRVMLTASQREKQALTDRARWLANGLAAYKQREHLSLKEMGLGLELSDKTLTRVLDGDYTVRLPAATLWKLEAIARRVLIAEKDLGGVEHD